MKNTFQIYLDIMLILKDYIKDKLSKCNAVTYCNILLIKILIPNHEVTDWFIVYAPYFRYKALEEKNRVWNR